MAIETPTWTYKSKGDKQTASEMNQLAQSVIINATELSNIKDDVAELSNKTYNPETYSGMGRVILRKNMVEGVNVLTQSMVNQANTIYEIRYDFDLNGNEIIVPAGCTLDFQGGSFSNGTIVFNSTLVLPQSCDIKNYIIATITGSYKEGQVIYDSTLTPKKMKMWNGTEWVNMDGTALI